MSATTLIIGASTNPTRYAYKAAQRLRLAGHKIRLLGIREGEIDGQIILTDLADVVDEVDTVTLYVGPTKQAQYYNFLVDELRPRRIIFNPGTENPELIAKAKEASIEVVVGCTLVMLASNQY